MELHDVIIIGGGPAGLNAAVALGRCRRKVLLFDKGTQRNLAASGIHNYLTRDDMLPADFLKIAQKEAAKYGVKFLKEEVKTARKEDDGFFTVADVSGKIYRSKRLLIATGLEDKIPDVPGMKEYFGKGVYHCPYCDAWESKDKKLGVYAKSKNGYGLALALKTWSDDVTLFTDGRNYLKPHQRKLLENNGVVISNTRIEKLAGSQGKLKQVVFQNGEVVNCDALFFLSGFRQQCGLLKDFGCRMNKHGTALASRSEKTNVEGLYVAGDASRDVQFVIVAAAEGAKAAVSINKHLQREEWQKKAKEQKKS